MKRNRFYLECDCNSIEHNLRFSYIEDDETPQLFVDVPLLSRPRWYKRVWFALKYVFGYRCRYGHFDEFVFSPDEVRQLKEFMEKFEKMVEKAERHVGHA
jgi:hypothetical protein